MNDTSFFPTGAAALRAPASSRGAPPTDTAIDVLARQATHRLRDALTRHGAAVFTTSLGAEDMVVLDLIARSALQVDVVTLDTGRLHEETYALLDHARDHYRIPIRALSPDTAALEAFAAQHGVNAFYRDIDQRKRCCEIRKTQPLARTLAGKSLWITGLRREQSPTRTELGVLEHDPSHGLHKLNPIVDWLATEVLTYAAHFGVPLNPLHDKGFPSIGCAPCTRAITAGEHPRAGRWWWENPETRECGLHMSPDGRLLRTRAGQATLTACDGTVS